MKPIKVMEAFVVPNSSLDLGYDMARLVPLGFCGGVNNWSDKPAKIVVTATKFGLVMRVTTRIRRKK